MQVDFNCSQHADDDDGAQQFLFRGSEIHIRNPGRPIGVLGGIDAADEVGIPGKDNDEHQVSDQHKICEFKDLDDDLSVGGAWETNDHLPEVNRKLPHNDAQADNEAEQHRQDQPAAESDHRFDTALRLSNT